MELKEFIQKLIESGELLAKHYNSDSIPTTSQTSVGMACQVSLKGDGSVSDCPTGNTIAFEIRF